MFINKTTSTETAMAQELHDDDIKQPGDQVTDEGTNLYSPLYPDYKFIVEDISDSLHITVKSKKSKRVFSNSFVKSALESMKLHGELSKIIHMIQTAKSGKPSSYKFKFSILFGSKENDKISPNEMTTEYSSGSCMFMVISVNEFFMAGTWPFKLLEIKREEIDIVHDIIEDLRNEIKLLKMEIKRPMMNPIVIWKSSNSNNSSGDIQWDIEATAPTLKGLATRQDSNKSIVIGIPGFYRISVRFGWSDDSQSGYNHYLKLNGTTIATNRQYYSIGFTMTEIVELKAADKLVLNNGGSASNWDQTYNSFTLELLNYNPK